MMRSNNRVRVGDLVTAASVVVLAGLYHASYFFCGPTNLFDTGVLLSDAMRLGRGELFGRDFAAPYGPARYELLSLFFRGVDPSLFSFDVFLLVAHGLLDGWTYLLARRVAGRPLAVGFTVLVVVAHGAAHKVFLLFATVVLLERILGYSARPDRRRALLLGVAVGVAGVLRIDVGGFGLVAAAGTVVTAAAVSWRERGAQLLALLGGGMVIAVIGFGRMLVDGSLFVWVGETLTRIVIQTRAQSPEIVQQTSFGWEPLKWLAVGGLLAIYGAGTIRVCRHWRAAGADRGRQVGTILLGVLLLNQLFLELKLDRLLHSALPAYLLLLFRAEVLVQRGRRGRHAVCAVTIAVPALLLLWVMTAGAIISQASPRAAMYDGRWLDLPRGRVRLRDGMADRIEGVARDVARLSEDGEAIYCGHACPIFYFLLDRPNPTRYTEPSYIADNPEAQQRVVDALEEHRPRVVILKQVLIAGFGMARNGPVIWPYLMRHYRRVGQHGKHVVLERRDE